MYNDFPNYDLLDFNNLKTEYLKNYKYNILKTKQEENKTVVITNAEFNENLNNLENLLNVNYNLLKTIKNKNYAKNNNIDNYINNIYNNINNIGKLKNKNLCFALECCPPFNCYNKNDCYKDLIFNEIEIINISILLCINDNCGCECYCSYKNILNDVCLKHICILKNLICEVF